MNDIERRIILASGSPRRLELLRNMGFEPFQFSVDLDEVQREGEQPCAYVTRMAVEKADLAARRMLEHPVDNVSPYLLCADTIVVLGDRILQKPEGDDQAFEMISALAERWHTVITAVSILALAPSVEAVEPAHVFHVSTEVRFRPLTAEYIRAYIATGEPSDKAGAYGVQGLGAFLVDRIEGSYTNVVGLPVCETISALLDMGAIANFPFPVREDT